MHWTNSTPPGSIVTLLAWFSSYEFETEMLLPELIYDLWS